VEQAPQPYRGKPREAGLGVLFIWPAYLLFILSLVLSVAFVKLSVGPVPVRSLTLLASLGLLTLAVPSCVGEAALKMRKFLAIIALFALLGTIVSLLNGVAAADLLQQLMEIHLQAAFAVLTAAGMAGAVGVAPVVWGFIFAVGLTAAVAIAQAIGLDFAWNLRSLAGDIMNDPLATRQFYVTRWRALGLSYSPVILATQVCLAFAAFFALRLHQRDDSIQSIDKGIVAGAVVAILVCIASGNRSPLLGFLMFLGLYYAVVAPRVLILLGPVLVFGIFLSELLLDLLAERGLRVASRDDGSAEGRSILQWYGLQLFLRHPMGYGLTFDSTQYWPLFAHETRYMENPQAIRVYALHNYPLMMLNKYGLFVIGLLLLVLPRTRAQWVVVLAFVPYLAHIFFHNDGPFLADFFIWYVLPLFAALQAGSGRYAKPPKRPWSRTHRAQQQAAEG
jgi:hypothetical protein